MKINELQKQTIEKAANKRAQLEKMLNDSTQELIDILFATTGQSGFSGYSIKEDELSLQFPKQPIQEQVKKLRKGKN